MLRLAQAPVQLVTSASAAQTLCCLSFKALVIQGTKAVRGEFGCQSEQASCLTSQIKKIYSMLIVKATYGYISVSPARPAKLLPAPSSVQYSALPAQPKEGEVYQSLRLMWATGLR